MSLLVGNKAPIFKGEAVIGGTSSSLNPDNAFKDISLEDYKGRWVVFFFYPLDFTFVCPTEIATMGNYYDKFKELNAEVVGCSTDSKHSHLAWRIHEPDLHNLPYPLLADFTGENARNYEVYKESTGIAMRGLYIIDPHGVLQYSVVHPEDVGRSADETLRVLQALQTGGKTACGWKPGDRNL